MVTPGEMVHVVRAFVLDKLTPGLLVLVYMCLLVLEILSV